MGFGKFLLGGLATVGAIIAAPVVLPAAAGAAALAGTAVTGAVAAAGTAVAGSAVGTAVTGAVAAAGTAVAGSAVGTAVTGAVAAAGTAVAESAVGAAALSTMATVGSAVGAAAGAVGIEAVASVANEAIGAAALGAITTSTAIGVGTAANGVHKISEASDIKERAEQKYNTERKNFNRIENETKNELEKFGKEKVIVWECFGQFVEAYKKINNKGYLSGQVQEETISELNFDELQEAQALAISVQDVVKGGVVSLTAAELIGMAASSGMTSVATASTGTAIAGLHGAAATNASLAALGGGAKAAGGLGMAGSVVVSKCLVFAPAAAIGGMFLNSKGSKALKNAEEINDNCMEIIDKMVEGEKELNKLKELVVDMTQVLHKSYLKFRINVIWLEELVEQCNDARKYTQDDKDRIKATYYQLKILKDFTMIKLIDGDKYLVDEAAAKKEECMNKM